MIVMSAARCIVALICLSLSAGLPAAASHLVSGNGYGFAVVSPESATVTKFYAHPYSFVRPDPRNPLSEGIETANFIKTLGWNNGKALTPSAEYENDSQVIGVHSSDGEGRVFMPFGLKEAAVIISWEPASNAAKQDGLHVEWDRPVKSQRTVRMFGVEMQLLQFDSIEESLLLIPLAPSPATQGRAEQILNSSLAWALISIEKDGDVSQAAKDFKTWQAGLASQALAKRELAEIEQWRVKPTVRFADEKERHLWRQSEVMLRIGQSREPNRPGRNGNGLIVASLPDGVFATPWVRDMAYATVALARLGHRDEARAALLAYFNARPTGKMRAETNGVDYQVSVVRYWGDGSEEPFFTQEGNTNIEFDDWGEVLWVLSEYLQKYDEPNLLSTPTYRGPLYESARDYIVKPLLVNVEKWDQGSIVTADTSIWEEHQKDKKHFAFSTAITIVALRDFAAIAHRRGDEATRTELVRQVALLEKGFNAAFIRNGKLRGTLEEGVKNDIDGALLVITNLGLVSDPAVVRDVVERMELLKVASGGYRRVRGTYTDPAIFEYWYEKQEFVFVDLSLAEQYLRLGRTAEANAMRKRIVDKAAADHNIIPEMYVSAPCQLFSGEIGDPTGALPMVGYGAGAYILHVLEADRIQNNQ